MLAHICIYSGFLEETDQLKNYPEITHSDTAIFKIGNIDPVAYNPKHNGKYDERLFNALSNHFRKIFILDNEPISLFKIHAQSSNDFSTSEYFSDLESIYNKIRMYLSSGMNNVTQFSFGSELLERTTVFELLNNYMAANAQHSKPKAQAIIEEINSFAFGNLSEMVRIMIIDLSNYVAEYAVVLRKIIAK